MSATANDKGIVTGLLFIFVGLVIAYPSTIHLFGTFFSIVGAMLFTYHLKDNIKYGRNKKFDVIDAEYKRKY